MNKAPILTIISPVYNDWDSFVLLLRRIDEVMADKDLQAQVLAVNDGSFTDFNVDKDWRHIRRIQKLNLIRNVGHQRAIAIDEGLDQKPAGEAFERCLQMRGDGDLPSP